MADRFRRLPRCCRPSRAVSSSSPKGSGIDDAKTATGVIRYGRDDVVAILDSTMVGRNVNESFLRVTTSRSSDASSDALDGAVRPDGLLLGIAPTGGKLPPAWRAMILEAIGAGLDIHSGLHQFLGDDPEFAAAAASVRFQAHRLPATAGPDGDDPRPPPPARQAGRS